MIVAIDGPAGVGKSSITRRVAERTGFLHLSSGLLYRAITWRVLHTLGETDNQREIVAVVKRTQLGITNGDVTVDGNVVTSQLHSDAINHWVSRHSAIPEVRDVVNRQLKVVADDQDVIVEGRDMSTIVFPDAEVKIYLDASLSERARRRFSEGTSRLTLEELEEAIGERDEIDRQKAHGALRVADDAVYLDTSDLTIEQVCEKVIDTIKTNADSRSY